MFIESLRAANQGSTQSAGNTSAPTSQGKSTHKMTPLYKVVTLARNDYEKQLVKTGDAKSRLMERRVNSSDSPYSDPLRFSLDYHAERERLVDSKRFCQDCEALGLVPEYVADHVVFEGKGKLNLVLRDGLQVLGENVKMFNCPLWKDSENLFSAASSEASNE